MVKRIMTGSDYYFFTNSPSGLPIFAQSSIGQSVEDIKSRYKNPIILRGKWTDDSTMHKVDKMIVDAEW